MIKIVKHQIKILILSSILVLMMFVPAVHASSCHSHSYGKDASEINQESVTGQKFLGIIAAIKVNVIQHDSSLCCTGVCSTLCDSYNIPVGSLLITSFENKQATDEVKTKYRNDNDLEHAQRNVKLQTYYRTRYPVSSSLLETTLEHRVLHI